MENPILLLNNGQNTFRKNGVGALANKCEENGKSEENDVLCDPPVPTPPVENGICLAAESGDASSCVGSGQGQELAKITNGNVFTEQSNALHEREEEALESSQQNNDTCALPCNGDTECHNALSHKCIHDNTGIEKTSGTILSNVTESSFTSSDSHSLNSQKSSKDEQQVG